MSSPHLTATITLINGQSSKSHWSKEDFALVRPHHLSHVPCFNIQNQASPFLACVVRKTILITHIKKCSCSHSRLHFDLPPVCNVFMTQSISCSTPIWFVNTVYQEKLDRSTPQIESLSNSLMKEDLSSKYQAYICQISNMLCSSSIRWQILPNFANFLVRRSAHHLCANICSWGYICDASTCVQLSPLKSFPTPSSLGNQRH